ncbi:MAG TPA: transglycosylase SLT domain-containing protein [Solirubrobacterales bacterium]|nr:transglycosylase SLT domain-containing protein [Solirubrobacterales bacterium]
MRRLRAPLGVLAVAAIAAVALFGLASAAGIGGGGSPGISSATDVPEEPFAYEESRRDELEQRATAGLSHVVFANSPAGATATAERVARFRDEIEAATAGTETDPDLLEAMVYLESAGRPEVIAGRDPELASGLVQILASTGQALLGMRVDLERSRELTVKARRAYRRQQFEKAEALTRRRARIDERFDPRKALDGAVRYLAIARERFGGANDLAIASYHMGIGNLQNVIRAYTGSDGGVADLVEGDALTYARLFFDSSPSVNPESWELLAGFGDESSEYYWKVLASREILRLHREDRAELRRLERLHGAKATAEEVFHPRSETEVFDDPDELADAWRDGDVVPIPAGEGLGLALDDGIGKLAPRLDADSALYRGLRPEALRTLILMAGWVRALNDGSGSLIVTSGVRDRAYQERLGRKNPEATDAYSLHTTGWSFDVLREYEDDAQAGAFQFVLDRLQALGAIDYAVEPSAIHVTVSDDAESLLD